MRAVSSDSTKEWMSSAVGSTTRLPSSAPTARAARPRPSSSAVALGRMPSFPSMAAWAIEPSRSSGRRRLSTEVEDRKASIDGSSPSPSFAGDVSQIFAMASIPRRGDVAALAGLRAFRQGRAVGLYPRLEPGAHFGRQAEEVDEALGILVREQRARREAGQARVVERVGGLHAGPGDRTLPKLELHRPRNLSLRGIDEGAKGLAKRAEPLALVHGVGEPLAHLDLEGESLAI